MDTTLHLQPMLLESKPEPFDNDSFIFEFKFDGVRMLACIESDIKLINRKGNIKTNQYPEIAKELKELEQGIVLDGEIIALDENGKQSFQAILTRDLSKGFNPKNNINVLYVVFDVLYLNGKSIMNLELEERKQLLERIFINKQLRHIRLIDYYQGIGKKLFEIAKHEELEGIVAKKLASPYCLGARNGDWIKIKAIRHIDALVGGYNIKSRPSLALGIESNDKLRYIGNVSNGLTQKQWQKLRDVLKALENNINPFCNFSNKNIIYLAPSLKAHIEYLEFTSNNTLRQPIIKRIYF